MKSQVIYLPGDAAPSVELLEFALDRHSESRLRFSMLERYYMGDTDILYKTAEDPFLPNNRINHAFPRYITNIATAYFLGEGLQLSVEDAGYETELKKLYAQTFSEVRAYEEAKEMSIHGVSFELQYIDAQGRYKTHFLKANELIPLYSPDAGSFLSMAVHLYSRTSISNATTDCADLYTHREIISFAKNPRTGWYETERKNHSFDGVPIIIRRNNREHKGDFEDVKTLVDAYDRAQSDSLNDLDYFSDAYLAVYGIESIVEEDSSGALRRNQGMKKRRTLFFPEGGDAKFITKDISNHPSEDFKTRVYRDIFFLSQVPNLTDDSFSGNQSGEALKYKLFGLRELAGEKEKYWFGAEQKKLEHMTNFINARHGTQYDWKTVKLEFKRNLVLPSDGETGDPDQQRT